MILQRVSSVALVALVVSVAAQDTRFTKASEDQLGLLRRDVEVGYEPEVAVCDGQGNTCAEVCGKGYERCNSSDNENHCYNPAAGEVCCEFPGKGTSCEQGYFCAHNSGRETKCCAKGKSLDECATINKLTAGALTSDPPVPSSTSSASSSTGTPAKSGPGGSSPQGNSSNTDSASKQSPTPATKGTGNAASAVGPASAIALLAIAACAALL